MQCDGRLKFENFSGEHCSTSKVLPPGKYLGSACPASCRDMRLYPCLFIGPKSVPAASNRHNLPSGIDFMLLQLPHNHTTILTTYIFLVLIFCMGKLGNSWGL